MDTVLTRSIALEMLQSDDKPGLVKNNSIFFKLLFYINFICFRPDFQKKIPQITMLHSVIFDPMYAHFVT